MPVNPDRPWWSRWLEQQGVSTVLLVSLVAAILYYAPRVMDSVVKGQAAAADKHVEAIQQVNRGHMEAIREVKTTDSQERERDRAFFRELLQFRGGYRGTGEEPRP